MSTQIERRNRTRAKVLAAARAAFAAEGYEGVALEKIGAQIEVSKGALYHHFRNKEALFAAVFAEVTGELVDRVGKRAARIPRPRARLKAVARDWLEEVERGDSAAIVLDLGPRVLGFAGARAIEDEIVLAPLQGLIQTVIDSETLKGPVGAALAARLIQASLFEIALLRRHSGGVTPPPSLMAHAINSIIDGLLPPSPPAPQQAKRERR